MKGRRRCRSALNLLLHRLGGANNLVFFSCWTSLRIDLLPPIPSLSHIVHEVTSPQAFEGLAKAGRKVRRLDNTLATVDHNVFVLLFPSFPSHSR
jgi:hypothetical protein